MVSKEVIGERITDHIVTIEEYVLNVLIVLCLILFFGIEFLGVEKKRLS